MANDRLRSRCGRPVRSGKSVYRSLMKNGHDNAVEKSSDTRSRHGCSTQWGLFFTRITLPTTSWHLRSARNISTGRRRHYPEVPLATTDTSPGVPRLRGVKANTSRASDEVATTKLRPTGSLSPEIAKLKSPRSHPQVSGPTQATFSLGSAPGCEGKAPVCRKATYPPCNESETGKTTAQTRAKHTFP